MEAGAIVTGKWFWRRLTHNLVWKLVSLALAVLLWYIVAGEPELVAIQPVPLLYRNLPSSLLLISGAPDQVRAELRGPSGMLTRATLSDAFAALDLSGVATSGALTFTLSAEQFNLPQGVRFVRSVPSQVRLHFDWISSKTVPVELQLKGHLPDGYVIANQTIQPQTLNISGPESNVSAIQTAETDPVDLSGLTQTTEIKVSAFVSEAQAQFVSDPVVTVRLTIQKSENTH
jgi:YbbR domain-containing protein